MSIANHNIGNGNIVSYAKVGSNTERIVKFVKYLHDFLPCFEQEFNDLEALQAKNPNEKFPIKMDNLAAIYQAEKPLYDLYVTKAPNRHS
jgi:hypothetical protein